jgi:hypothetical protein
LKSALQLEEYHNKLKELQSLQSTADNAEDDNDEELLNTQLQTT